MNVAGELAAMESYYMKGRQSKYWNVRAGNWYKYPPQLMATLQIIPLSKNGSNYALGPERQSDVSH